MEKLLRRLDEGGFLKMKYEGRGIPFPWAMILALVYVPLIGLTPTFAPETWIPGTLLPTGWLLWTIILIAILPVIFYIPTPRRFKETTAIKSFLIILGLSILVVQTSPGFWLWVHLLTLFLIGNFVLHSLSLPDLEQMKNATQIKRVTAN